MKTIGMAAIGALVVVLGGCETLTGDTPIASLPEEPVALTLAESDQALGALQQANIPEKSCGMILWTLEAQRPSAIFRYIVGEAGEIVLSGRTVSLTRIDQSGASGFGVFENQQFQNEDGVEVEIASRFGLGFDGGAYIERGLIKVRDASGWSIVAPTAGIAGCRS